MTLDASDSAAESLSEARTSALAGGQRQHSAGGAGDEGGAEPISLSGARASAPLTPEEYAAEFSMGLRVADNQRSRTIQTESGLVGVSDLGVCREKARRRMMGLHPSDVVTSMSAMIGHFIHEGALSARKALNPDLLIEETVQVALPNGCVVPGHADEIDTAEPSCTDIKTVNGLEYVAKHGPTEQQRWQRALYYEGARQAGTVPDQGIVRNIWVDRSGSSGEFVVDQEPFDPAYVQQASAWLDDVLYAAGNGEEASKDKPLPWCLSFCEYTSDCRKDMLAGNGGVITDPEVIQAAITAKEAREQEKYWKALRDQAQRITYGHDGVAGDVVIRQVQVNKAEGGYYIRQEYR